MKLINILPPQPNKILRSTMVLPLNQKVVEED